MLDVETGKFYLVNAETDTANLAKTGIDWELLSEQILSLKATTILFLDACHSGALTDEKIISKDKLIDRLIAILEALGDQPSAMCLGGRMYRVDTDNNGFIEFSELTDYVRTRVISFSKGEQTPLLVWKEVIGDFPIAGI